MGWLAWMEDAVHIRLDGQQHLDRAEAGIITTFNQKISIEFDDTYVYIEVAGLESRQRMPVASLHPAVIAHYRQLDYIQRVIQIAEREAVPEPIRLPVFGVPAGMEVCDHCDGSGLMSDPDAPDMWIECRECKGDGLVADEWSSED